MGSIRRSTLPLKLSQLSISNKNLLYLYLLLHQLMVLSLVDIWVLRCKHGEWTIREGFTVPRFETSVMTNSQKSALSQASFQLLVYKCLIKLVSIATESVTIRQISNKRAVINLCKWIGKHRSTETNLILHVLPVWYI
ncbi:hypothetical protein YC2023_014557 [Brassica napus]